MGPGTVARDRFDLRRRGRRLVETQMLLNLVKIRYSDIPVFMDVGGGRRLLDPALDWR